MLDLNLTTLYKEAGQEQSEMPGLYAVAPKKAARLRAADRLVLLLSQTYGAPAPSYSPLPPNLQQELLSRLAETYYASTGSVTAGMKAMAERLNEFLINRNLRQSRQQTAQVVGLLNMVVVHGSYLYITQAGAMHAYLISGGKVEHFTDAGGPARGLGLAKVVNLRYFQTEVQPDASLVLCAEPGVGWNETTLGECAAQELSAMRAALIGEPLNLEGALIRFSAGRGDMRIVRPAIAAAGSAAAAESEKSAPGLALRPKSSSAQSPNRPRFSLPGFPAASTPTQGVFLSGKGLAEPPAAPLAPEMPDMLEITGESGVESAPLLEAFPAEEEPAAALIELPASIDAETSAAALLPAEESLPESGEPQGEVLREYAQALPAAEPAADLPPWEEPPALPEDTAPRALSGAERAVQRAALRMQQAGQPAEARPHLPADAARHPARAENAALPVTPAPLNEAANATEAAEPGARREQPQRGQPRRQTRPAADRRATAGPSAAAAGAAHAAGALIGGLRQAWGWAGGLVGKLAARTLPDQPAEGLRLSSSTMLFIALAVPVLVVAISATVYFQRGRGMVRDAAVHSAQQYADRAATQSDTAAQRDDYNQAIVWLDRAENYGQSDAAVLLRRRVQAGLDSLDGIARLEFRPALSGTLGEGVHIKRMIAVANDVYLLTIPDGKVMRVSRSGQGYEIDAGFMCSPGEYGGGLTTIGPLVDITTVPGQNFVHATIMGLDAQGNVLFCQPGEIPSAQTLLPPDINWGMLSRAVHLQDALYVLDTQANQVYRYFYSPDEGNFVGKPTIYFDLQIPRLGDVVDLAADQEYLYLLHSDGSMTSCNSSGANTLCDDPAPYGDSREGHASDPLKFEEAAFITMQSTQPPDPSLYLLDTNGPSIYNLSHRRLNLQKLFQPTKDTGYPPAGKAPQAFAVTPNRRVLLAVDNQLYLAALP